MNKILLMFIVVWSSALQVKPTQDSTDDVRLMGGTSRCTGRLEMKHQETGEWRPVHDDYWNLKSSAVVCQQMACGSAVSTERSSDSPNLRVWQITSSCVGSESSLRECGTNSLDESISSVILKVICSESVRLVNGTSLCSGRVEVKSNKSWVSVCEGNFDQQDAEVVCRELGCGAPSVLQGALYGEVRAPMWTEEFQCKGSESVLLDCGTSGSTRITSSCDKAVGLTCSEPDDVRLAGGSSNCTGKLEMKNQGEWRPVDGSSDWNLKSSSVVCRQLLCGPAVSTDKSSGSTDQPVWWITSTCIGYESSLRQCVTKESYTSSRQQEVICSEKPKAILKADQTDIPVGGSVTLSCSVEDSSEWNYYWYQHNKDSLIMQDGVQYSTGPISVSEGGIYWCRGGRGEPVYYTEYSDAVTIDKLEGRSVLILQPSWSHIFTGETITLKCEILGRSDTDWKYEWITTSLASYKPENQAEFRISSVFVYHSGVYVCKGRAKNDQQSSTGWSHAAELTVSAKPTPVLGLSPSWLSVGHSVTLSCDVKESSEGWRFYWYRAVPKPSDNSYTYELLPGSHNETVDGSYIIHGPTGTGGYVCKAGRGDPVYYTEDSEPQFVWSGDLHPSASLTVSSSRTQHFIYESVSLSCEGNSTEWKMKGFNDRVKELSSGLLMNESTWTRKISTNDSGVYWCESGLGEYSNAVNITVHDGPVILVSPVHPVTEGLSMTLGCKHERDSSLSNVDFYRNGELVQTKTNGEMIIPSVSKSDEGFYKCKYSGEESPQSWMAVALSGPVEQISTLIIGLIVGLLVVILLTIFLVLLCRYRTSEGRCCVRTVQSQGSNQRSADYQNTNQIEAPDDVHLPLQHDDNSIYEVIQQPHDYENDPGRFRPVQSQGSADYQNTNRIGAPDDVHLPLQHGDNSIDEVIQHSNDNDNYPACVRPVQSQGTNQGSADYQNANESGAPDDVYLPLQHGDTSFYEVLKRSTDYENDGMGMELGEQQNSGKQLQESSGMRNEST